MSNYFEINAQFESMLFIRSEDFFFIQPTCNDACRGLPNGNESQKIRIRRSKKYLQGGVTLFIDV